MLSENITLQQHTKIDKTLHPPIYLESVGNIGLSYGIICQDNTRSRILNLWKKGKENWMLPTLDTSSLGLERFVAHKKDEPYPTL